MKAIIETSFDVRGKKISSYHSFPVFSSNIEDTMSRSLEFLERHGTSYKLNFSLSKD